MSAGRRLEWRHLLFPLLIDRPIWLACRAQGRSL